MRSFAVRLLTLAMFAAALTVPVLSAYAGGDPPPPPETDTSKGKKPGKRSSIEDPRNLARLSHRLCRDL